MVEVDGLSSCGLTPWLRWDGGLPGLESGVHFWKNESPKARNVQKPSNLKRKIDIPASTRRPGPLKNSKKSCTHTPSIVSQFPAQIRDFHALRGRLWFYGRSEGRSSRGISSPGGGLTRIRCFRVVVVVSSCRRGVVVVGSKIGKNRQKSIMSRMIQTHLK